MWSLPVVVVEPVWQCVVSGVVVVVGDAVGPFAAHGLVETLDLAVGAGGVWPGPEVADPVLGEQLSERPVVGVGPGVVGHDPLWLDAQRSIPVKRSADEGGDGVGALVGVQLGVGDARVVVDD